MPFGMKNYPVTFQRLVNSIVSDLENCEVYIDYIIIYSKTWEEHLRTIRKFFVRLSKAKLRISLMKSEFGCATVMYLGQVVGQGHVKLVDTKITSVSAFHRPTSEKQVMHFLGMAGYYKKFCPNFSSITKPLMQLLSKNIKFNWNNQCDKAFEELKAVLVSAPVLSAPNFVSIQIGC